MDVLSIRLQTEVSQHGGLIKIATVISVAFETMEAQSSSFFFLDQSVLVIADWLPPPPPKKHRNQSASTLLEQRENAENVKLSPRT